MGSIPVWIDDRIARTFDMTPESTTSARSPALLEQRSLGGIFVHLLALLTGIVGAGIVYLISNHEFTRANARNAFNWHLTVLVVAVLAILLFLLGADEMTIGGQDIDWGILPEPLGLIVFLLGAILLVIAMVAWVLTLAFTMIAMIKAIFGSAWEYPLARRFLD